MKNVSSDMFMYAIERIKFLLPRLVMIHSKDRARFHVLKTRVSDIGASG